MAKPNIRDYTVSTYAERYLPPSVGVSSALVEAIHRAGADQVDLQHRVQDAGIFRVKKADAVHHIGLKADEPCHLKHVHPLVTIMISLNL